MKKSLEENIARVAERNLAKEPIFNREKQKLSELHYELGQRRDKLKALRGNQGKTLTEHREKQTTPFVH